ncbi:DNA repair protein rad51c [Bulinus truncatus]|nr:DNA repair protein rad51c [Bulinus truncatus]
MAKRILQREINTFPINPTILSKLASAGLKVISDFKNITSLQLSSESSISAAEAQEVLNILFGEAQQKNATPVVRSVLELFRQEQESGHIITFCESLDNMLGGGVPLCKITEICGAPGLGKTQLCLQLAVDTHIPLELGGVDGEAVYIDTEGSFIVDRLVDIATATVDHCELGSIDITVEKILAGIHYFYCQDYTELLACVHLLPSFLSQHQKVKLVIVDSIACPFRQEFSDMSLRTKLLSMLAQSFSKMASQKSIAVVLINQMSTKIPSLPGSYSAHLIPALGESWAHVSNIKLLLNWEINQRKAMLYKSPNNPELECFFQITAGGIRDITNDTNQPSPSQDIVILECRDGASSTTSLNANDRNYSYFAKFITTNEMTKVYILTFNKILCLEHIKSDIKKKIMMKKAII